VSNVCVQVNALVGELLEFGASATAKHPAALLGGEFEGLAHVIQDM
jgi:hypothetical protein